MFAKKNVLAILKTTNICKLKTKISGFVLQKKSTKN